MTDQNNFNDAKRHINENLDALLTTLNRHSDSDVDGVEAEELREHPDGNLGVLISYLETKDGATTTSYAIYDQWGNVIFSEDWDKSCWNESKIIFDPASAQ